MPLGGMRLNSFQIAASLIVTALCFPFLPAAGVTLAVRLQLYRPVFVQAGALPAEGLRGHHRPQPVRPQRGQVSAVPP